MSAGYTAMFLQEVQTPYEKSTWAVIARNNYRSRDSISVVLLLCLKRPFAKDFAWVSQDLRRITTRNALLRRSDFDAENLRINSKSGVIRSVYGSRREQK